MDDLKQRSSTLKRAKNKETTKSQQKYQEKTEKIMKDDDQKSVSSKKKKIIKLGLCAMKKKIQSKPMRQILKRLECPQIQIIQMWQFLDQNYKTWPIVDVLICFYSDGFPYLKAWKYTKKNKPFLINNLDKQQYLWDRTVVYDILKKIHIPVAKNYMVYRDMNYLDQIEIKAFLDDSSDQQKSQVCRNSNYDDFGDSGQIPQVPMNSRQSNTSQKKEQKETGRHHIKKSFSLLHKDELKINLPEKIQHSESTLQLNKTTSIQSIQKNQKTEQSVAKNLTANKKQRNVTNKSRPNALRKFHQQRISNIEQYQLQEIDDSLFIKSQKNTYRLDKPFVQKPFDAENHQICIYYPESMGGGRKMLFRKIKNSSSKYEENQSKIRRDGNYIYEQFLPTNAFDIKVYTIGAYYMYAEARKSPTLDGVVDRNSDGKQKRYPIILTPQQKFIAQKIVQQFGQEVCGFDMLRANGKSFVCDVNGWSFVKGNSKYWDDCSIILKRKIFTKFFPELLKQENRIYERFPKNSQNSYRPPIDKFHLKKEELRSIVSIFRHGDRSPKLKLKFKTGQPSVSRFVQQFFTGPFKNEDEIKIKDAKNLTKLLQITNNLIAQTVDLKPAELTKLGQMKTVLESGGHFEGLNRKCQLKVASREGDKITKLLIVVKWGGQLSLKGHYDAVELGKRMRMEKYKDDQDFLSLHSSYRHDLKTYSSDQGRCIKTAASFLKGFLNIEGGSELAPIITTLVNANKKAQYLLDCTSEQNHSEISEMVVKTLSELLNSDEQLINSFLERVNENEISPEMFRIIKEIGRPREKLKIMHKKIIELSTIIQNYEINKWYLEIQSRQGRQSGVSVEEDQKQEPVFIYKRWSKLQKDFYNEEQAKFNISKIPQIYDTIRHDMRRNAYIFSNINFDTDEFKSMSKLLALFVVPNQYGMSDKWKVKTAQNIASPLLQKILNDLMFWKEMKYEDQFWKYKNDQQIDHWKHIRTRLYFTSASHIYSVMHLITLGNQRQLLRATSPETSQKIRKMVYMSYLSHIQFRLYENLILSGQDPNRFRVQVSISPDFSKGRPIQQISFGVGFTIEQIKNFILKATPLKKKSSTSSKESPKKKEEQKKNKEEKEEKDQIKQVKEKGNEKEKQESQEKLKEKVFSQ